MSVRLLAALAVALLFGWAQLRPGPDDDEARRGAGGGTGAGVVSVVSRLVPRVALADNNDEDNNGEC